MLVSLGNAEIAIPATTLEGGISTSGGQVLNAAGYSHGLVGKLYIEGGGSKTLSAAGGGKILWRVAGSLTFANAGTNIRVGINDVTSGGLEDGTHDVYRDVVGGSGELSANSQVSSTMSSGSKTMADGDLVAFVIEMTARGGADTVTPAIVGSANSVNVVGNPTTFFPYQTRDGGSGPAKLQLGNAQLYCEIQFDDGTVGWIYGAKPPLPGTAVSGTTLTFSSSSTPDEYAMLFRSPFRFTLSGIRALLNGIATTDTFEIIVYSDPTGTPVAEVTDAVDPNIVGNNSGSFAYAHRLSSPFTVEKDTWYAVAFRPTLANPIGIQYFDFGSGNGPKKAYGSPFGEDIILAGRTNQTGAFSTVQDYYLPNVTLMASELDDGGPTNEAIAQAVWEYANRTLTA